MRDQSWLMRRRLVLTAGLVAVAGLAAGSPLPGTAAEAGSQRSALQLVGRLPLLFVPEEVPAEGAVGYVVRGRGASVWVSAQGLRYRLHSAPGATDSARSWVVALDLVGATPRQPVGGDPLPTRVSHFTGPRSQWRTGLPSYASVVLAQPWPGIDLVVSGQDGRLETSFLVRPGADPGAIRLAYRGASSVRLEAGGALVAETPFGSIRELAPSTIW